MWFKRGDWFKLAPAIIILIAVVGIASAYVNHKISSKDTNLKSQSISTLATSSKPCTSGSKDCSSDGTSSTSTSNSADVSNTTETSKGSSSSASPSIVAAPNTSATTPHTSNNSKVCSSFYDNLQYGYSQAVDGLAGNLSNTENQSVMEFTGSLGLNLNNLATSINDAINSTNVAISNDWTNYFVTSLTTQCDSPPSVQKLQVPQCDSTTLSGVANCISQINPSLGV